MFGLYLGHENEEGGNYLSGCDVGCGRSGLRNVSINGG